LAIANAFYGIGYLFDWVLVKRGLGVGGFVANALCWLTLPVLQAFPWVFLFFAVHGKKHSFLPEG